MSAPKRFLTCRKCGKKLEHRQTVVNGKTLNAYSECPKCGSKDGFIGPHA